MNRREPIPALTGLRFLAALAVFIAHFGSPHLEGFPRLITNLATSGFVGVGLFFVLSGFILTYVYEEGRALNKPVMVFWTARFARIYPVYFFSLIFAAPVFLPQFLPGLLSNWFHNDPLYLAIAKSGGFLASFISVSQAWFPTISGAWNNVAWSLSAEVFFYFTFPFVLPIAARLSTRSLAIGVLMLWISSFLAPVIYLLRTFGFSTLLERPFGLWDTETVLAAKFITQFPLFRVSEFLIGICFGLIFGRLRAGAGSRGNSLSAMASLIILVVLGAGSRISPLFLSNGLLAPAFGCLILGLALGGGPLDWFLSRKTVVLLGEASYAFYLLHYAAYFWIRAASKFIPPLAFLDPRAVLGVTVVLGVTLFVSLWVYKVVEVPARRHLLKRLGGSPATPKAGSNLSAASPNPVPGEGHF